MCGDISDTDTCILQNKPIYCGNRILAPGILSLWYTSVSCTLASVAERVESTQYSPGRVTHVTEVVWCESGADDGVLPQITLTDKSRYASRADGSVTA